MRITGVQFHKINIPFEAPLRWSGGLSRGWTRCIVRMQTDEGIEGIGETLGGTATLVQLEDAKPYFIGVLPPEEYEATVALREAFSDKKLRFDPNGLWSVETSIRIGKKFEALDLEYYEDPCWGLEGMHRVRKEVHIPFATNLCVVSLEQLPIGIRLGAIDVVLIDPQDWGGPTATMKAVHTCQVFQIGVGFHSGGEAGVSTALYCQLGAALPVLPYALDSYYHHQTDDVITEPFGYENGCFKLPEGPGLGVELDLDKLARLEEDNRRNGDLIFYGHKGDPLNPHYMGMW